MVCGQSNFATNGAIDLGSTGCFGSDNSNTEGLLQAGAICMAAGGRLCLSGIQHDLMKIFKLTKLNKVLEIHESVDNALAAMA